MLFQNPSFFPYNQGFYPMISTNDYPFQQSFPQQTNQYFNNQGNSQEHKILEAIQSLEKKFEDKIFRVEQNQNHLNNVVDGLVSDVVDLKKKKEENQILTEEDVEAIEEVEEAEEAEAAAEIQGTKELYKH